MQMARILWYRPVLTDGSGGRRFQQGEGPSSGLLRALFNIAKVSVWVPWIRAMASRRREQLPQCARPDPPTPTGCTEDTDCKYEDGEQCNKHNGQCYKRNTGIK